VDGLWATKSEGVGLIDRAISFQEFQPMSSRYLIVTDRRTDRQTKAISIPRYALVHRAVIILSMNVTDKQAEDNVTNKRDLVDLLCKDGHEVAFVEA